MLKIFSHLIQYTIFLLLVLSLAALLLFAIFYEPAFHILAKDYLHKSLGTDVQVQKVRFDLKNTSMTLSNVKIENPAGFPQGDVANLTKIFIDFEIADLDDKLFHVESLIIEAKNVQIMKNAEGEYNWFNLKTFSDREVKADLENRNLLEEWLRKLPLEKWFEGWRLKVDRYILDLGHAVYKDFSTPVPLTLNIPIKIEDNVYAPINSMREVVRIIAWETLLVMEQGDLKEPFQLIKKKVETKLGSQRLFIEQWKNGKK